MKTIQLIFISAVLLLFTATSCIDDIVLRGNGIEASEARLTNDFTAVKSEGNFDVHITPGDEYDILIIAESNLIPYIETDVTGNTLRIHTLGLRNLRNRLPMEVYVTTPFIDEIKQSGSGIITTGFFESDYFEIKVSGSGIVETALEADYVESLVSGSGDILLSGIASDGDFTVSGSGEIDAWDLALRNCEAKVSGSGNIWLNVERFLRASISGSGTIFYWGYPTVETHISGSGDVIDEN